MNKFLLLFAIAIAVISCDNPTNSLNQVDNFDHQGQIAKDNDSITKYLETHYYNEEDGAFWTIGKDEGEKLALINDPKLEVMEGLEANDLDTYKMYYYRIIDGADEATGSPSPLDDVYVTYSGMRLDSVVFDGSNKEFPVWFSLTNNVQGWGYGLQKMLGGIKAVSGDPEYKGEQDFRFKNYGEGYLIFPSGLGYRNSTSGLVRANDCLIFKVELHTVNLTDHDGDSVLSRDEIEIVDYNVVFTDADSDGVLDYLDQE